MNESRLARDFGISRIPIREALMHLHEQGLLMNHPRRGMFVNSLSEEDTQKINSVRIILEGEAIKLCRTRLTRDAESRLESLVLKMEQWEAGSNLDAAALDLEFHRAIWNYTGNEYLNKTLMSLVPVLMAHHALDNFSQDVVRWRLNHHRALLEVIQGKSPMSPEEALVIHLRMAYTHPERYSSLAT